MRKGVCAKITETGDSIYLYDFESHEGGSILKYNRLRFSKKYNNFEVYNVVGDLIAILPTRWLTNN